jgi:hypothetical protein
MLAKLLPTDVPPYFWMTHGTCSSEGFVSSGSGEEAVRVDELEVDIVSDPEPDFDTKIPKKTAVVVDIFA